MVEYDRWPLELGYPKQLLKSENSKVDDNGLRIRLVFGGYDGYDIFLQIVTNEIADKLAKHVVL